MLLDPLFHTLKLYFAVVCLLCRYLNSAGACIVYTLCLGALSQSKSSIHTKKNGIQLKDVITQKVLALKITAQSKTETKQLFKLHIYPLNAAHFCGRSNRRDERERKLQGRLTIKKFPEKQTPASGWSSQAKSLASFSHSLRSAFAVSHASQV